YVDTSIIFCGYMAVRYTKGDRMNIILCLDVFLKMDVNAKTATSMANVVVLKIAIIQIVKKTDSNRSKNSPGISTPFANSTVGKIKLRVTSSPNTPILTIKMTIYKTTGIHIPRAAFLGIFFWSFNKGDIKP